MLSALFRRITQLRTSVRSLLYLYFIFGFTGTLTSVFVQIKVFIMFPDLSTNIIAAMFSFTGVMIGFCVFGYVISHFRLDAKQGFYYSFISFAVGLVIISQVTTISMAYLGLLIYGLGNGFFWLTVHTYEITETKDAERDFYSSVLEGGRQMIAIAAPLVASGLIWISLYVLHAPSFALLFTVAPFFYLLGLFCFKGIQEYRPERIEFADVTHFLFEKKNRLTQVYLAGGGAGHILSKTLIPVTLFYILGTELRVGIYSTIIGILSVVLIIILGHYRNQGNRLLLFGISSLGLAALIIFLGYSLTFFSLVMFIVVSSILQPIMQISDHVILLQTMETGGRSKKDFYATMILQDFSYWFWRMVTGVIALFICQLNENINERLSWGLYFYAAVIAISFIGARLLVPKVDTQKIN